MSRQSVLYLPGYIPGGMSIATWKRVQKGVSIMNLLKRVGTALMIFVLAPALILSGCGSVEEGAGQGTELEDIVERLYENADAPPYETIRLDKTNFEAFAFIPYDESLSAVEADALVNITPHSVVVIHDEKGNGESLAEAVFENADPFKWLCVSSEKVNVAYTDHYVVLIMSYEAVADSVAAKFGEIAHELDGMKMTLLSKGVNR